MRHQPRDCRAEVSARIVPELGNQWVRVERPLNHGALHPLAPPVNQPHFAKAGLMRRAHVFLHNVHDLTRRKGVQVEGVFDR